jgi:hypothetical protein
MLDRVMTTRLYGLDIETCTDGDPAPDGTPPGLDPRVSAVISVAVWDRSTDSGAYFTGDEPELLCALEAHLASLPGGVIVTWNGANFDLPYLADRFAANGIAPSLQLRRSATRPPKYSPLPGHCPTGYEATWGPHRHLDVAYAYQKTAERVGVPWRLKPMAAAFDIDMITVDASAVSELDPATLEAYNLSDAAGTAELAAKLSDKDLWSRLD